MHTRARLTKLVLIGLVGLVTALTTTALAATTAAQPLELVFAGSHEQVPVSPDYPFGMRHVGTFTSRAGVCASGTVVDLSIESLGGSVPGGATRRYTCADGSGTLTMQISSLPAEHEPPFAAMWTILGGTGSFAGYRGKGNLRGELLSGDPTDPASVVFRSTFAGLAAADTVPPTITVSAAKATKRGPRAGTYALRLTASLLDDVADNDVDYTARIVAGGTELTRRSGTTHGAVSWAPRIRVPRATIRSVRVEVIAIDPVGNEARLTRTLRLPR